MRSRTAGGPKAAATLDAKFYKSKDDVNPEHVDYLIECASLADPDRVKKFRKQAEKGKL